MNEVAEAIGVNEYYVPYGDLAREMGLEAEVDVADGYVSQLEDRILKDNAINLDPEDFISLVDATDNLVRAVLEVASKNWNLADLPEGFNEVLTVEVLGVSDRLRFTTRESGITVSLAE